MRILFSILPLILMSGTSSFASNWYPSQNITQVDLQPLRCPTVGKDFSQMISQLEVLQDKIKKDANCGQLAQNFEKIKYLSGDRRKDFLEAVSKINGGATLSDAEMEKKVLSYAEDVTVASASLATLLSQSDQCFGEQDLNTSLSTLSSFVNEASTLLSTVAGPWGPALSVGGKVVAGFLTGVNKFIQSLPGYDFKDKKEWQGYVETLCSFHEQQDEIAALIHPDKAIRDLNQLNSVVSLELQDLIASSRQAPELLRSFESEDNEALSRITNEMNEETKSTMGMKAIQLLAAQKWILNRIENIEVEMKDPLAPGQYLVQKQKDEIEAFLVHREGPKFISFQIKEAVSAMSSLNTFINYNGVRLYMNLIQLDPNLLPENAPNFAWVQPEVALKALLEVDGNKLLGKGLREENFVSELQYFRKEVESRWDSLNLAYGVKSSFCEFFKRAGYYSSGISGSCSSGRATAVERGMNDLIEMGLTKQTPAYLRKAADYQGANWTESLQIWVKQLD